MMRPCRSLTVASTLTTLTSVENVASSCARAKEPTPPSALAHVRICRREYRPLPFRNSFPVGVISYEKSFSILPPIRCRFEVTKLTPGSPSQALAARTFVYDGADELSCPSQPGPCFHFLRRAAAQSPARRNRARAP